jgi:hypothetical protein
VEMVQKRRSRGLRLAHNWDHWALTSIIKLSTGVVHSLVPDWEKLDREEMVSDWG